MGRAAGASADAMPCGEVVDRAHAFVVAAGGDVRDQDQPLPPVVEHDRAIDHQQADRWTRRVARLGRRVPVESVAASYAR